MEQPLWLSGGALGPVRTTCWPSQSFAGAAKSGRAFETRCASPVKSDKSCSKEKSRSVAHTSVAHTFHTSPPIRLLGAPGAAASVDWE